MHRSIGLVTLFVVLAPLVAQAAPPIGSWQIYTVAHGLAELPIYAIAPDGAGGAWVSHVSGGRGMYRGEAGLSSPSLPATIA